MSISAQQIKLALGAAILCLCCLNHPAIAQEGPGAIRKEGGPASRPTPSRREHRLKFQDTPIDMVLREYGRLTGRTLIIAPNIAGTLTLRSQAELTKEEYLQAVQTALAMRNVTLVPMGAKFFKVVQIANARQEGLPLDLKMPEEPLPDTDHLISQMVVLKYLTIADIQPIIQSMLHGYGKIQALERTNTILITDTESNIQRILEILEYVDQPIETSVETRIYELHYAEAGQIASKLATLIQESQSKENQPQVAAARPRANTPPGIIRARKSPATRAAEVTTAQDLAARGIIQGAVKVVADDRTNILIVISDPCNFAFFDKIIDVLDRAVAPEITVQVIAMEYADAEEISGILNEFIGAASSDKDAVAGGATERGAENAGGSQALRDYVARKAQRIQTSTSGEKAKIGQLSADTKILADKRTNSILLMGRKADLAALQDVISQLDIMLGQVLIEAVIIEVGLNNRNETGISWLQRSVSIYNEENKGPNGGIRVTQPITAFGGGWASAAGNTFLDGSQITRAQTLPAGALNYYMTFFDLNIDAIIRMVSSSGDARVLSSPVILTTDNTEATIVAGEERPIVTATTTDTGTSNRTSSYEYKTIGIELTVTPRINPRRLVVMEIKQSADNVGDTVQIDGNDVPIITKRELTAEIAVQSRSTIVLGGMVNTTKRKGRTKIPLLGDIPILGALFRSDSRENSRTELLVLITPYVLMTPEEARRETLRVHAASEASRTPWPEGWSDSELAPYNNLREEKVQAGSKQEVKTEPSTKADTANDEVIQIIRVPADTELPAIDEADISVEEPENLSVPENQSPDEQIPVATTNRTSTSISLPLRIDDIYAPVPLTATAANQ